MSLSGRTPACPRQRGRTLFPSARGAYQPTRSSNGAISRRDGGRELACPVLIARVGQEPCVGPPATPPISPTQPSDGGPPAGRRVTLPLLSPPWRTCPSTRSRSDLGADRWCFPADGCWRRSTSRHPA